LQKYTCQKEASILEALEKIDSNTDGFLIILDKEIVLGVVTDGDIRRDLITHQDLSRKISSIANRNFSFLTSNSDFNEICKLFKIKKNKFLPILNKNKTLLNFITRDQFNNLLLNGENFNSKTNFGKFVTSDTETYLFNRPWGFYKTTFISIHCQAKIMTIFPYSEISLQKHHLRDEHWVVINGSGEITIDDSNFQASAGKYFFIPRGKLHQIVNNSENNLVISEIQLGSYFGEDDIIRYKDKYGRK